MACEDCSYEKVISPMSDITSRAELAEGSRTVPLQDFQAAPTHRQLVEEGKNNGADGRASQLFGFSWKRVLSCCLVVAGNFSHTLAKIFSDAAGGIWMVYRPISCRSAPASSHTAFRRDIAMS